ncbi:hypothetical protein GCM10011506_44280 [Marivirga lumbricoides]|uniref:Uncharacterized protein n=1 Tax=Marivirga lumbricoides TaxID=1046115 RepID=A0ABQ1N5B3_9BACT|nr:hypothetical protein GCM10011506_44280 [Marivirga lumbricoides]
MSHILLEKWKELEEELKVQRSSLDRETLLKILLRWTQEVKKIKDEKVQELYHSYLEYFENCFFPENNITPWYSLKELIDVDLLNRPPLTYDRAVIKVRDVLWELLVFKSDILCPCCGDDNLRVMVNNDNILIFTCDLCGCILNESGKKTDVNGKLYPAPMSMIRLAGITANPVLL